MAKPSFGSYFLSQGFAPERTTEHRRSLAKSGTRALEPAPRSAAATRVSTDNGLAFPELPPNPHRPMRRVIPSPRAKRRYFKTHSELGRKTFDQPRLHFHGSRGCL